MDKRIASFRGSFVSRKWPEVYRSLANYTGRGLCPTLGQARAIAALTQKITGRDSLSVGELRKLRLRFEDQRPREGINNLMNFYNWCAGQIDGTNVEPVAAGVATARPAVNRPRRNAEEEDIRCVVLSVVRAALRKPPAPEVPLADLRGAGAICAPLGTWVAPPTSPRIRRSPGAPVRKASSDPPTCRGDSCRLSPSDEIFVPAAARAS